MDSQKIYDDFISKYPIYQDNRVFKLLINKFKDVFVKDVYDDIPKIFKQLYENNEIPSDVYDYFLIDIGVSEDLIKELSNPEKLIFIKGLSDFQKYKSTVGLVKNVVQAYGDSIEVYELYVDYDKQHNVWECKPYLIYKPNFSESYNKSIPYKIIYEKIPNLLIHEKQLDQMRLNNVGIFPIKTNIIFLNSDYSQSITSYLQNLIISVFCNTYSDEVIDLYFIDQLIPCTLYQFILLWLYLIFVGNNNNIDSKLNGLYICFNEYIDISISELDGIINEYESIGQVPESLDVNTLSTRSCDYNEIKITDLDIFYNKYIKPNQINLNQSTDKLDKNKIQYILRNENKKLIDYIDNELNIKLTETSFIFNILINSIQVYQKTKASLDFIKYFKYFKSFLPSVNIIPLQNTIYKILYYTKPFHTEILNYINVSLITSQDVFNNIYFKHFYKSNLFFTQSDSVVLENFQNIISLKPVLEDIIPISAISEHIAVLKSQDEDLSLDENVNYFDNEQYPDEILLQENFNYSAASVSVLEDIIPIRTISEHIAVLKSQDEDLSLDENVNYFDNEQYPDEILLQENFIQLYSFEELLLSGYGLEYGLGYGLGLSIGFYW